jgi:3',5'-cyclic AMP phosphodiesterase CpdA
MPNRPNRRSFLKITGASLGIGVLYSAFPSSVLASPDGSHLLDYLHRSNGEAVSPFSFVQLSDAHVGFNGPPDPLGTKAFERAVELINRLPNRPDLVLFTGDLTHDSEDTDERAKRFRQFQSIAGQIKAGKVLYVPGEHDAGIDNGALYRELLGESYYSFDHRGVHFVALDNVSRAKPEVGPKQLAWLKKDLARFPKSAPIVVFTHRPLFDLKPEWEWFTSDGDEVMNVLAPYENVTVLYGHIHRDHEHQEGHVNHYGARSLIFAFPDPEKVTEKKPAPFDPAQPFRGLGIRTVQAQAPAGAVRVHDVELTLREYSGINGIHQLLKEPLVG